MIGLIKLKLDRNIQDLKEMYEIQDTFLSACMKLDASIFEPFIKEDAMFEDKDKYRFLSSLKSLFDRVRSAGVESLTMMESECHGCHPGHKAYEFKSEDRVEFTYLIYWEEGRLKDIFRCYNSTNYGVDPF